MKPTILVGGQAVIEGVMMRVPGAYATAVRDSEGKIHVDNEFLLIIKTMQQNYEKLENWVQKNHSYDVPEIISIPIHKGLPAYLKAIDDWVGC